MRVLLDTHCFIWWFDASERLSAQARTLCEDPRTRLTVSVASLWEMQIKIQLGKLGLSVPLDEIVRQQQAHNQFDLLPVHAEHVLLLGTLPPLHRDPFDRLLIAQALQESVPLVSADPLIAQYQVNVIW